MAAHKQSMALSVIVYITLSLFDVDKQYMQGRQHIRNRTNQARAENEHQTPTKVTVEALTETRHKHRRHDCSKAFHITPVMYII